MVTKKKVTKTITPKKVVNVEKEIDNEIKTKVKEDESLEASVENIVVEENSNDISKVIEKNEKEDKKEKNTNLFQTMKDIIWF